MSKYKVVSSFSEWKKTVDFLGKAKIVAVDLEADGLHNYPEKICLFQFAARNKIFIVESEALGNADELRAFLADKKIEKVFHSCDYDVRSLDRDYNAKINGLFDTSIAAKFLGADKLGLGNVLLQFLGIEINKCKKLQKMNWSKRPLPGNALNYASDDVAYLIELRDFLLHNLERAHRLSWAEEEFKRMEAIRFNHPAPPELSFFNIKGCGKLNPKQLGILREVNVLRDKIALEYNRPPFKIAGSSVLIEIATNPDKKISDIIGVGNWLIEKAEKDFVKAVERGMHAEPVKKPRPLKQPRWTNSSGKILKSLKSWRLSKGDILNIDPSLIWPMASLEKMALHKTILKDELFGDDCSIVRKWQRDQFSNEIFNLPLWKKIDDK